MVHKVTFDKKCIMYNDNIPFLQKERENFETLN